MGLRLYQAPVESDIQQKPLVDKGPAQARSTIRRHRLARGSDLREQTRERRRRFLASSSAYLGAEQPTSAAGLAGLDYTAPAAPAPTNSVPNYARRAAMIDMVARTGVLDDRVAALFDDRFPTTTLEDVDAIEHRFRTRAAVAASRDRQERQERRERRERDGLIPAIESYSDGSVFIPAERLGPLAFADEILGQERSQLHQTGSRRGRLVLYDRTPSETRAEPYTLSSIRSTQAPDHPSRSSTASPAAAAPPFRRPPPATVRRESRSLLDDVLDWPRSSRRNEQTVNTASSRLDGLGDRNRSLSPEGDNVWDTLLTTLTPDPQPPSVGSSFASASATLSAATAAQTTAAPSSRTSFSLPEIAENAYLFDPLCEFNSDTDDDHNDNEDTRNSGSRPSQRWADIARYRNSEDNIYAVGNEAALQRIVAQDCPTGADSGFMVG